LLLILVTMMKLPFKRESKSASKNEGKKEEVRSVVARRLGSIKKGEKNEALDGRDLPNLVKGLADGDG